jgi:hypothetical protein
MVFIRREDSTRVTMVAQQEIDICANPSVELAGTFQVPDIPYASAFGNPELTPSSLVGNLPPLP